MQNTSTTDQTHRVHTFERVDDRLAEAGFDADTRKKVFIAIDMLAKQSEVDSEAIRIMTLPGQVGESWGDRSNGNQVWAIVRGGVVRTCMLRRSTQPSTPQAFNVDRVRIIA